MNRMQTFLNFFDFLVENCKEPVTIPDEVQEVYNGLKQTEDKPVLTETGALILEYLQTCETFPLKAKDIAEGMELSSRKVSGAMRKLVDDAFVEKYGSNPVVYTLTEKGKQFNFKE